MASASGYFNSVFNQGYDPASDYSPQQKQQMAADPFAAAEEMKRKQRLADWIESQKLPAQARVAAESAIMHTPIGGGYNNQNFALQAQRSLLDQQALHPNASAGMVAQNFVTPWAAGPATAMMRDHAAGQPMDPMSQQGPPQQQAPGPRQQAGGGAGAMQQLLPGVGVGSVNGQQALYPVAGHAQEYAGQMQRLGLNPSSLGILQPGQTPGRLLETAQKRELDLQRQQAMNNPKVMASTITANGKHADSATMAAARERAAQIAADARVQSTQLRTDGLIEVHHIDANGKMQVSLVNTQGQQVVEGMKQAGWNQRADERNKTSTDNAAIRAGGVDALPDLRRQQGRGVMGFFGDLFNGGGQQQAPPQPQQMQAPPLPWTPAPSQQLAPSGSRVGPAGGASATGSQGQGPQLDPMAESLLKQMPLAQKKLTPEDRAKLATLAAP